MPQQRLKSQRPVTKKDKSATSPQQALTSDTSAKEIQQEAEDQFEVELCWCIQQLETCLVSGKIQDKQAHDLAKQINILKSGTAPLIKKRQVMRNSLGDYRARMVQDKNKYHKAVSSVKFTSNVPTKKSVFVRKAGNHLLSEGTTLTNSNNCLHSSDNTNIEPCVAQNHSALFMSARERLPGLLHGQIYTYPSKRWRKKRRQYLMHYLHPKRGPRGDVDDGADGIEAITHINDDSKDSVALKDEHSKDAWYYDEQDMLDMDTYDEPDPESDYDYEESYSSKRKRRKPRGGGHHPARSHPPSTESPSGKRTKGGGRGRKKTNYDAVDTDKPFVCDLCSARYKTRPGLVYHYGHSHSTSSGDPAKEQSPSPAEVEPRSVAETAASNQPGGTRRGRQNASSSSTSSPSPVATPSPAAGPTAPPPPASQQSQTPHHHPQQSQQQQQQQQQQQHHHQHHQQQQPSSQQLSPQHHSPQHQQQPQQPPPGGTGGGAIQMPVPPGSPTLIPPKEEHATAAPSPGSAVPSPAGTLRSIDGPATPGGNEKRAGKSALPSPYCDFCLGDARENKKTGGSEELVSCSDCGRSGHPTCLQFTANMIVSVRKYRWQCIECKCCSICGTSDNDDQLLFCDDCDRGYHMYCLSPPLASPPEGSWSCRLCIAEFHRRD